MSQTDAPEAQAADSLTAAAPLPQQDAGAHTIDALHQANAALEARLAAVTADCRQCRSARAAAQRLETLGHLAGGMAHDFSNVLQAVLAVASLLKRNPHDPERVLRQAEMLEKATARGSAVTGRLLAYGRTREAGIETVEPNLLLPHLRESLQPTMPDVTISVQVAPGVPHLTTDRSQLEMTLINLANNARDAMFGRSALMTLSAEWTPRVPGHTDVTSPGGFVCLAVRDTGCGMDAATVTRASEPFFTTKPPGKGTGLGLALAYRFCRQSGGALTIDSTIGSGTTIRMYLPAGDVAQPGTDPGAQPGTNPGAQPGTGPGAVQRFAIPGPVAILVQNEPVLRDGLRSGLLARGFRVADRARPDVADPARPDVADAARADVADRARPDVADPARPDVADAARPESEADPAPDLLVVDLSDDQPSGMEALRAWRQLIPGLPVVVLVDRAAASATGAALKDAAVTLTKPVAPADLADAAIRLMAACGRPTGHAPPRGE